MNRRGRLVTQAEKDLDEGRFTKAAQAVAQELPTLHEVTPGVDRLSDRSMRIVALASSRTDGAVKAYGFVPQKPEDLAANVDWAIRTLRALAVVRDNEPSILTDLGEALARVPAHEAEAPTLLGDLAGEDLLTSARGYRALAGLRDEAGDTAARDAALARCKVMAKGADICRLPPRS